jgi:hypothetical protein
MDENQPDKLSRKMPKTHNPPAEENSKHEEMDINIIHALLSVKITKAPKAISCMMHIIAQAKGKLKAPFCLPKSNKLKYSVRSTYTNRADIETTQTFSPASASTILHTDTEHQDLKGIKWKKGLARYNSKVYPHENRHYFQNSILFGL